MSKDIIGISIGSKNTVIGTYKKGTFEVVLSETSSRTIPTIISYTNNERNFGEISQNKNRANYKNTIIYPNRWLGIQKNYSLYNEELKYANIPPKNNNNILSFNIYFKGKKELYAPESLMGLFFSKIKNIWLKQKINTNNIVVSIPDYSTVQERKAMQESVLISGLNCISLLNESSAISLAYAFQKLKEFQDTNPRLVAFIDMGHSQSTIFFAEFTKKLVKVVSVSSERFCGARDMDYLIAENIAYEFQKRYGLDPLDSPKAKISLINAINKCRKTLTVNKDVTISVDSLLEGHDIVYDLNREKFENIISPVLEKFEILCKNSIQKALSLNINLNNLYSVEMVGDTLRTPILNNIIKKIFNKELSKTLVPDECIARGCALFSMMNSPYYQIQNFAFQQYNSFLIQVEYPTINQIGQESLAYLNLFLEGENFPSTKNITLNKNQLPKRNKIQMRFFYCPNNPNLNFLPNKLLNSYNIYLPSEKKIEWTLNIIYTLDINLIPQLVKATIKEKLIEQIPLLPSPNDYKINQKNNNIPNNPNKNNNIHNFRNSNIKSSKNQNINPNNINQSPQFAEKIREIETSTKTELTEITYGTPQNILNEYINKELYQNNEDIIVHEAKNFKNALEQYIYDTRSKIDDYGEFKGYFTNEEKKELIKKMDELMEWLYSDDEGLYNKHKLEEKSKDMKALGDQIYQRYNEWNRLNEAYEKLSSIINETIMNITDEETEMKKGKKTGNLTEQDIVKIKEVIKDTFKQTAKLKNLSDKKEYTKMPPVSTKEIEMIINGFNDNINKIYNEAKQNKIKEENNTKNINNKK